MKKQVFCHVDGCDREAMYKADALCQKHYFRRMRYGHFGLNQKRQEKLNHSNGYVCVYAPGHCLASKGGYVYEHRVVMFDKYGNDLPNCEFCGQKSSWGTRKTHIDHIDEDRANNSPLNLRILCNACNVARNRNEIKVGGIALTAAQWARRPEITSNPATILRRIRLGVSPEIALFAKDGERIADLLKRQQ